MTFDEAWELGRWGFIGEDSAERMNQFVDDRSVISKLTEPSKYPEPVWSPAVGGSKVVAPA